MKQDNRDNSRNWQTTNTGGTNYVGEIHFHGQEPNSLPTRQEYRNRQALLNKVKNFWVKGVLEKSLYNQVLIELGLEERLDAVANPWSMVLETGDSSPQPLPQGTKVIDIFDQIGAGRTLLILGEPGAGKTTTLLELTRDLITRAEQDVNHLIPVVFNLSSWAVQRQKIADWLVEELKTKYDIPKEIRQDWVKKQQLLPLLDGLDEVKAEYRNDCIAALNQFKQDNGAELVVCSRIRNYEILSNRLNFQSAVYLKALTLEQVRHYLDNADAELIGLRELFKRDTALQELSQSPLMLNIMTLAYQGVAVEDLPQTEVVAERRKQLFDTYIQKMFKRRGASQRYERAQARCWLIWLAQRMQREDQTGFLIDRIQPYWLQTKNQAATYQIVYGLIYGLIFGILSGFIMGGVKLGLIQGIIFALFFGLILGRANYWETSIRTVESLRWSYNSLQIGLIIILILGIIIAWLTHQNDLVNLLNISTLSIIASSFLYGLRTGSDISNKIVPNQGIFNSTFYAVFIGLASVLGAELLNAFPGLRSITFGGLIIGFNLGGKACLQHFTLRLILYCQGYIPWNYARFLDYAAERIFLQKVGGGYIFIHRLLLEHFAQMKLGR
jgi:hypothetical protein